MEVNIFIYTVNIILIMSEKSVLNKVNFCVVYCKSRKKVDKYFKVNKINKKTVLDIKQIMDEEMEGESDIMFLKILIFNKIQKSINKGRDIYFIPNFDDEFSIKKMLNLKTSNILGANNFNILLFYNDFSEAPEILSEALENLSHFDHSQIIKDY